MEIKVIRMVSYRKMEKMIDIISNFLVTVLVVVTFLHDMGIEITKLIIIAPEIVQKMIEQYLPFFWGIHIALLFVCLVEGYIGSYVRTHNPKAYREKYIPTVSMIIFVLAFLSFLAFRSLLDLILMLSACTCIIAGGTIK